MGDWEVHSEHYLVVKVLMTGKVAAPLDTGIPGQSKIEGDFQILSIKPLGTKPVTEADLAKKEWEEIQGELKSGRAKA